MPIVFTCPCGKTLRVADEHAGKRVKCPACNSVATVPAAEPMFEVVENTAAPPPPPPPKPKPVAKAQAVDDDDEDDRGYGVAKSARGRKDEDEEDEDKPSKKKPDFRHGSGRNDDDDEDDRPRKKKKKKRGREDEGGVAGMYMAEAREQAERDERRSQGNSDGGLTFLGITVTGGVIAGVSMFVIGMIGMGVWMAVPDIRDPKVLGGGVVCACLGVLVVVKAIFFGEED